MRLEPGMKCVYENAFSKKSNDYSEVTLIQVSNDEPSGLSQIQDGRWVKNCWLTPIESTGRVSVIETIRYRTPKLVSLSNVCCSAATAYWFGRLQGWW